MYFSKRTALQKTSILSLILSAVIGLAAFDTWGALGNGLLVVQILVSVLGLVLFLSTPRLHHVSQRAFFVLAAFLTLFFGGALFVEIVAHSGKGSLVILAYLVCGLFHSLVIPALLLDSERFRLRFFALVSVLCAFFAFSSIFSLFFDSLLGLPFYIKRNYEQYAGFPATAGLYEHPSHIAILLSYGVIISLYLFGQDRRFRWAAFAALCVLGIFLSQGRIGLIFLAAFLLLGLGSVLKRISWRLLLAVRLGALIIVPLAVALALSYMDRILLFLRVSEGTSGRGGAWVFAASKIIEQPLLGYGQGFPPQLTAEFSWILRSFYGSSIDGVGFHNSFINLSLEFGIIVTATFCFLLIYCSFRVFFVWRSLDQSLLIWILFVSWLALSFVGMSIGGLRLHVVIFSVSLGFVAIGPSRSREAPLFDPSVIYVRRDRDGASAAGD